MSTDCGSLPLYCRVVMTGSYISPFQARTVAGSATPVTFGDLSDEELDAVLEDVAATTMQDICSFRWASIVSDVTGCFATLMSNTDEITQQLGGSSSSALSGVAALILLVLSTPVAFVRNLLVLAMEAPFSNATGLLLLGLLVPAMLLFVPQTYSPTPPPVALPEPMMDSNHSGWLILLVLPMLAVWRVQLRAILTERDAHIAGCIKDACAKHGGQQTLA